jgi:hypothetical protein
MAESVFRDEFQRGLDLWHDGQPDAAIRTFAGMAQSHADDWRVRFMLGAYL